MSVVSATGWHVECVFDDGSSVNTIEDGMFGDRDNAVDHARGLWKVYKKIVVEIRIVSSDGTVESLWRRPGKVMDMPSGYYAYQGNRYYVSRPDKGKWAGWIFVQTGSDYHDRKTIAKARPTGEFVRTSEWGQEVSLALAAHPFERMVEYGKITGCCGRCGRKLEDPDSIRIGMGPVCREKF